MASMVAERTPALSAERIHALPLTSGLFVIERTTTKEEQEQVLSSFTYHRMAG